MKFFELLIILFSSFFGHRITHDVRQTARVRGRRDDINARVPSHIMELQQLRTPRNLPTYITVVRVVMNTGFDESLAAREPARMASKYVIVC